MERGNRNQLQAGLAGALAGGLVVFIGSYLLISNISGPHDGYWQEREREDRAKYEMVQEQIRNCDGSNGLPSWFLDDYEEVCDGAGGFLEAAGR